MTTDDIGRSRGTDYFLIAEQLTESERDYLTRTQQFVDHEVLPVINDYWERAEFPFELIEKLAKLDIVGDGIEGYGCPPMSPIAAGLVNMELNRGDGSLGTFYGVHCGLAMKSISMLGSEEQKQRWLPQMARLEKIGAFALTEPAHGSDSIALETSARREGDDWVLNGAQAVDRQRDHRRCCRRLGARRGRWSGQGLPGREGHAGLPGRQSSRARWRCARCGTRTSSSPTAGSQRRTGWPARNSFKDTGRVLSGTRNVVAWGSLGHAVAAYEIAVAYAKERHQFGKPLVGFQLIQDKLVEMLAEVTAMQLYCLRLGRLIEDGRFTDTIAALAKLNNTVKAREVCATAREILGGNGILLDYHVVRHMADMEALYTFEGTAEIQTLIVGRDITGVGAFA